MYDWLKPITKEGKENKYKEGKENKYEEYVLYSIRYLKGSPRNGINIRKNESLKLSAMLILIGLRVVSLENI